MFTIKSISRIFSVLLVVVSLALGALGATPAQAKNAPGLPVEQLLNPDGTLDLGAGYSGNLDIANYGVTLDPARGPVFSPLASAGTWNSLGATPLKGYVSAIAISGASVYAGGSFSNIGGSLNPDSIAKWNGTAWSVPGARLNSPVNTIAISGTNVYVGGFFTNAGGNPKANYIAKWNGATWSALGAGLNNSVFNITVSGANVYVGGDFINAGGDANADHIAKWNGATWSALGTGLNDYVLGIAVSGANVYAGGHFTDAGGDVNADYIAKWNGIGWSALGASLLNDDVYSMAVSGTDIYVGGWFTDAGGIANADYIAKWNGATWSALGAIPLNDSVWTIAISGANVYAGGEFTNAGGNASADYIARWNGSAWSALGTSPLDGRVQAIAVSGADVYAGGDFRNAGGHPSADAIARFRYNTVTATLNSIGAQDGQILESSETSNAGGALSATAATFNLGDNATKRQYRGILSFNTATLPDTAAITGVTLKVKQQAIIGGGNPLGTFQGFMADVKNGFFDTTAVLQPGDFHAAANKSIGPFTPVLTSGWYSINLTGAKAYINKLATNGGLTQIRLRFKLDDNNNTVANVLSLYSGNAPAASRPQLVIQYYVP